MYNDILFWEIDPSSNWYGFEGYGKRQYFIDSCKFQYFLDISEIPNKIIDNCKLNI